MFLVFLPGARAANHATGARQSETQSAVNKTPDGRWALLLMGLFAVWAVGVYATWDEQAVPAGIATAEEKVLALNRAWAQAEVLHDELTIRRILHDQFVFTDEDGRQMGKSDLIAESRGLSLQSQTLDHEVVQIENDRALIAGIGRMQFASVDKAETLTYGFTCVYVQQDGEWKVVEQKIARVQEGKHEIPASLLQASRTKTARYSRLPIAS